MKSLDPFHIDLEKTTLIEASAGTGKTYTITTLFCRLIAKGYKVESILVVTFTEAAAAELKLRIRTRLFDTLSNLSDFSQRSKRGNKHDKKDDLPNDLIDDLTDDLTGFFLKQKDLFVICQRFYNALNCFDQSSVMTIHSFCLKTLKEYAFESGSFFDIELVPDRSMFLNQAVRDFFMSRINNLDTLFLSYLNLQNIVPDNFISSFIQAVSKKGLVTAPPEAEFKTFFNEYRQVVKKIHNILLTRSQEIIELIANNKGIQKKSYSKKNVPAWLEKSCEMVAKKGENTLFKLTEKGDALYKFTKKRIESKTNQGAAPPEHELFDLCEKLLMFDDLFKINLISLKIEFLSFFSEELEKTKKSQGICFFDDLVNDLAKALSQKDSFKLQNSVRQSYKACLIDEFQDTDPKQYEIFSRLFSTNASSNAGAGKNTPFFMIGDPKQAIYAFRGGDIFAYLKASKECDQKFTLKTNYRSAPLLVTGVNKVFFNSINPFLFEQIEFTKVAASETAQDLLVENSKSIPSLQFCFIQREDRVLDRQGFISKSQASDLIPEIVAKDIVLLLESDKSLCGAQTLTSEEAKPINPGDIAVLVRTNDQAQQIQKALFKFNIPSYLSSTGSVFDSEHGADLYTILQAVYDPASQSCIKAALCTLVFGFNSNDIIVLDKDPDVFHQWQERFASFNKIWETAGFVSMIMSLFHCEHGFLKTNPGLDERGMTNFYHLVELISKADLRLKLSPYYLLKWYERQLYKNMRDQSSSEIGSDELRLETDKKAVAIVTIHKSKGLEYPIVYLPYLWEGQRKIPKQDIFFHNPDKDHMLTLDLGSKDIEISKECYEREEKAEQRRLLYVALTRASAMCRIIWGGFNTVETSALGSMIHTSGCKDDSLMLNDLEQLGDHDNKSISVEIYSDESIKPLADQEDLPQSVLSARQTTQDIKAFWKTSSFSAIARSSSHFELFSEKENYNKENQDIQKKNRNISLADFPKGAGAGDLFHSIFEDLDFTSNTEEISNFVAAKFDQFSFFDKDMINPAITSVKEVLETRLVTKNAQFYLKDITSCQRFNELEFIFPVQEFKIASIIKAFEHSDLKFKDSGYLKKLSSLTFHSFRGFIKGFIDLVIQHKGKWYIVDYKSNYLGNTYDQYSQAVMFDAMSDHHYFLQYYIYITALHRYLQLRLKDYDYNTHFGGVFYLFIRGMHPDYSSQYGVFHDRPEKSGITELSNLFYKDHIFKTRSL